MAKNITKIRHRFPFKQIRRLPQTIASLWPIIFLLAITILISFLNYEPGTWLTGWDNLHPEFNFFLDIKRGLFSVWQEYRGLGLLAGMAHAADLPRVLILFLLHYFFPSSLLRYLWTFSMLFLGSTGTYLLTHSVFLRNKFDQKTKQNASFLAALFYLLNLSTIQTFYVPFETFTSLFGFLPWLLYLSLSYLQHPKRHLALLLFLTSFLSSPSFYVETIFIVFCLCLSPFIINYLLHAKFSPKSIKNVTITLLCLIIPHLYWLLPIIYFVLNNGSVGLNAHINLLSSPETLDRNLAYANLPNLLLLKGYLFSFTDLVANGQYDYLLKPWIDHLNNPVISITGYFFFFLIASGLIYSLKKNLSFAKSTIISTLICFFFLIGGTLIVGNNFPIISELFRSPFTKFSIPLSLFYSLFFSVGTIFLMDLFSFLHSQLTYFFTTFSLTLLLITFSSPVFSGYLISPSMRQKIPTSYFQLFQFFQTQSDGRIANFPQINLWGWNHYSWGYRGSGFLWYGLPQSLMDRAFDVWNNNNENYYSEISQAIYSQNQSQFESVINKYHINWLLIDKSVIPPDQNVSSYLTETINLIESSNRFSLQKTFGDNLLVYQVKSLPIDSTYPLFNLSFRPQNYLSNNQLIFSTTINQDAELTIPSFTQTENLLPLVLSYQKSDSSVTFKLEPIIPQIKLNNQEITIETQPNYLHFSLPENTNNVILELNQQLYEIQLPGEINTQSIYYPLTTVYLPTQSSITTNLYSGTPQNETDITTSLSQTEPYQCYTNKPNRQIEKIISNNTISLLGTDVVGCLSLPLPRSLFNTDQLLSFSYVYSSPTFTPANASLSDSNLVSTTLPQTLEPKTTPTFVRQFAHIPSTPNSKFNLILEANEVKTVQEIRYTHITLASHPLINSSTIQLNSIPDKKLSLDKNSTITLDVPIKDSPYYIQETPQQNSLLPSITNCNQFSSGTATKQTNTSGFLYSSRDASGCDYLNLRHLPHNISYAINIELEHLSGLNPSLCLENFTTRHCDIFERLSNDSSQTILNPIVNPQETPGYTLHLFNQSYSQRLSQNLIKSLTITPLPLNFIQSLSTQPHDSLPQLAVDQISSTTHPAEFLYLTQSDVTSKSRLNLYQSYSSDWIIIKTNSKFFDYPLIEQIIRIPTTLISQKPIRSTKNDWYNSWTIEPENNLLIILFWPQYLQFLGTAILLISTPILLLTLLLKRKHK